MLLTFNTVSLSSAVSTTLLVEDVAIPDFCDSFPRSPARELGGLRSGFASAFICAHMSSTLGMITPCKALSAGLTHP